VPSWGERRRRFEQALAQHELFFPRERGEAIDLTRLPSLISLYRALAIDYLPPGQPAFVQLVADLGSRLGVPQNALVARALLAYPAFVRQHHFELVLREAGLDAYACDGLDHHGVDILILQDGLAFGVDLSVGTQRAQAWQNVKVGRHDQAPPVPVLQLYADPGRHRIGPFWLHPPEDAERVRAFIEQARSNQAEQRIDRIGKLLDRAYLTADRRARCSRRDFTDGFHSALSFLRVHLNSPAD
jgi:hypothetical protein